MGLIAKDKGGEDFALIPPGIYQAICYGVVDLGTQPSQKFKPKRTVVFIWELPDERIDIEKEGVKKNLPRATSKMFTLSLSLKSNLRPFLQSWRGKPFTEEEAGGFELKTVLGANCLLNLIHEKKADGKTFANVASITPMTKGMVKKSAENPLLFFSFEDVTAGPITFPVNLPEWMHAMIMMSDEYLQRSQHSSGDQPPPDGAAFYPSDTEEDVPF
jgi:hypothetical protein